MSSLKFILKGIFPRVFLKNASGVYRRIKNATLDKFLFPEYAVDRKAFQIYRQGYPFRENAIEIKDIEDEKVRSYMQSWYDWTQEEFLLVFDRPCTIEPDYGWAIIPPKRLLVYSLGLGRTWLQPKPSMLKFLRRGDPLRIARAISLRDTGEENYFHFYNDVLAKIFFLKAHDVDVTNTPVIIAKKLWDKSYFQYYLSNSPEFKTLHWIVQEEQYIECQSAIFCKPLTHRKDLLQQVFAPLYFTRQGSRKLYVTRSKTRLRFIENEEALEALFRKYNFERVDTDQLSPGQQIELFAEAAAIVGIHGAGLANMFFRLGPCQILEIFAPPDAGYLPFHYIMIARMKGFSYHAIIGKKSARQFSGGFYVDPDLLERNLKHLTEFPSPSLPACTPRSCSWARAPAHSPSRRWPTTTTGWAGYAVFRCGLIRPSATSGAGCGPA